MMPLTIEGYVVVSADGMLAENGSNQMPDALRFAADQAFVAESLQRVALVVRGRHSTDDFSGREKRRQIIVTRGVAATANDPTHDVTLWNPQGASFETACTASGIAHGGVAILGGPDVYALFLDRFDVFYLSEASGVRLPQGKGCFPGVPKQTPQQILSAHGMIASETRSLDAAHGVTVAVWRRG